MEVNEIDEAAEKAIRSCGLLPEKSKQLYEKTYSDYVKWCNMKDCIENYHCEKSLLAYFWHLPKDKKPSSLWSLVVLFDAEGHNKSESSSSGYLLAIIPSLFGFLKRKSEGFKPKKSKVLTMEEIESFLYQAPDEIYLTNKVALIGIAGACRRQELTYLELDDIHAGSKIHTMLITLRDTKTKTNRMFSVVDNHKSPSLLEFYQKYAALRPPNTESRRFFLAFRNGKCSRQVVGKNIFGDIPRKIAAFLKLPNPELYIGHAFRRSSATLLANSGEGMLGIKQIGGWKSTSVAEQYIEDSVSKKVRLAEKVFGGGKENYSATSIGTRDNAF